MQEGAKLVVVTREDLSPGQQAVQAAHAAIDFCFEHPGRAGPWHLHSNYLCLLSLPDEEALLKLKEQCEMRMLDHTVFREPDIGNRVTAIAIEPSPATQKLVKSVPLLFQNLKINSHVSI